MDDALDRALASRAPRAEELPIPDKYVLWAERIVESMGILGPIASWKAADVLGPGGAPATISAKAVLIAFVLAVRLREATHATVARNILYRRISDQMRARFEVPAPPESTNDTLGWLRAYANVRRAFHRILDLVDPSPYPKNRRLTPREFKAAVEGKLAHRSEDDLVERGERLAWLVNQILEASIRSMPRKWWRRWKGDVAIDATPIPAFARPDRRRRVRGTSEVTTHSSDPDAGWYVRDPDRRESPEPWEFIDKAGFKASWAFEASLAIAGCTESDDEHSFPYVVVAMDALHKPGQGVGHHGVRALASTRQRGHPARFLAGDRAYNNQKPEHFQLPARALGYQPIWDFRTDQLGVQSSYAGALQVEGSWYCPAMPAPLVSATEDVRLGAIDKGVYEQRLASRAAYRLRPKQRPDNEGHVRMLCPASGECPTARCDLKPRSLGPATSGKTRVFVGQQLKANPPRICSQQSVTLPPEAGAKFDQAVPYGTTEWRSRYSTLRNTIEGVNGYFKDGSFEDAADATRRRIRGVAAQTIFVALLLFAANLRKIDAFTDLSVVESDGIRRRPRRRKTAALGDWSPSIPPDPGGNAPAA